MWTARLRALRAVVLDPARAEPTARQAVAEGERAHDALSVGYALHVLYVVQNTNGEQEDSLETIERALGVIGEELETTDLRLLLPGNRSVPLDNLGRTAQARRAIGEAVAQAERAGSPRRLSIIRIQAADNHFRYGQWDEALAELDGAAADLPLDLYPRLWMHGIAALICCHRDERTGAAAHVSAVDGIEIADGYLRYYAESVRMAQAMVAERDGRLDQAVTVLRETFDATWAADPVARWRSHLWLPDVARLGLATSDRALAQTAAEFCQDEADRLPLPNRRAAAEHCRGLLAADPAPVLTAADLYRDSDLPLFRAQALENAAVLLARHGEGTAARAASTTAIEIYHHLGAAWDVRRANARLRQLGIRHGYRGRRTRPESGWAALTPTELKIAGLIAAGRSNPDIAAELWLSRRTVQSHVSHILTKLSARSRIEIARAAFDRSAAAAAS